MLDVAVYLIYIGILVYAAVTDWRTLRISNHVIVAIMLVWLVWHILRDILPRFGLSWLLGFSAAETSAASGVLAAVVFGAALTLFTVAYEAITHKYSMGGGDVKLMAVSALFLGLQRSLFALMVACVAALVIAPVYAHVRKKRDEGESTSGEGQDGAASQGFPFGPAIVVGSMVALLLYKI